MKSPEQSNNFFTESETLDGKLLEIVVDYEKTDQVLDILLRQYHSNDYPYNLETTRVTITLIICQNICHAAVKSTHHFYGTLVIICVEASNPSGF